MANGKNLCQKSIQILQIYQTQNTKNDSGADVNFSIKGVRKQSAEEILWPLVGTRDGTADKTAQSRDSRLILFTEDC